VKLTPKLALIGLVAAAIAVIAIVLVPVLSEDDHQNADGRAMALKEGLHSIQHGVRRWAAAHDSVFPPPSRVTREGLDMLSSGQDDRHVAGRSVHGRADGPGGGSRRLRL
jgi:hypothetical protein